MQQRRVMTSCAQLLVLVALGQACVCFCACARLTFTTPEWGEVADPSVGVILRNADFESEHALCLFHLALNQETVYSGPLNSELVSIVLTLAPGHHQLAVYTSMQPIAAAAADKVLADTVLFSVRNKEIPQNNQLIPVPLFPTCPQLNSSALPPGRGYPCRILQGSGHCDLLPATCDQWGHDQEGMHRSVDAQMGSSNASDASFWLLVDSCIYSVLAIAARTIALSHLASPPSAFQPALLAAASTYACPGALKNGEWARAFELDVRDYWRRNLAASDSIFFVVVSGTSFMTHRARAVRCSWAARARNVLLISGQQEIFNDRCSQMAGANLPEWHALRSARAVLSPKNLTSRALVHDDFFSSVPKFMLSLLLAWQLNPSANWYYMAGCDTAVHPAGLAALLSGIDPSRRVLVGGHVGVTRLLRSQLFLSGGAGLALSRAAVVSLIPIIEDFTENWLLQEGAASRCIPCADIALQRLCEREGIDMEQLEGFYAHPPSHYLGTSVLHPHFTEKFPWEQLLPQCHKSLRQHVENQSLQDALQSMDGRWGRSRTMGAPPVAFHYLGPRRLHQTWLLMQSLHVLHSKGLC